MRSGYGSPVPSHRQFRSGQSPWADFGKASDNPQQVFRSFRRDFGCGPGGRHPRHVSGIIFYPKLRLSGL